MELLATELKLLDLPSEVIEVLGGGERSRYILLSGLGAGPTLYLHGHYDVVLASHPGQLEPIIRNDRTEWRGASDMKCGIAAMAYALDALQPEKLNGPTELVLVPDEETVGKLGNGSPTESERLGHDGIGAIIGEPTSGVM